MNKSSVSFYTLGCRVNQYEEQHLRESFEAMGFVILPFGEKTDFSVVNTCAVTGDSEQKSRNIISRARKNSGSVIVTGCYGELINRQNLNIDGVYYTGGCKQKNLIPQIAAGTHTKPYSFTREFQDCPIGYGKSLHSERCRGYIKIQDGCNGNCSYCLIPQMRGPSCSRNWVDIISEANRLSDIGVNEIILTGIEISDYEYLPLHELVLKIAKIHGIKRIRLGSININCISNDFLNSLSECEKFCRHMHLSVQSASDRILRLMKRPYNKNRLVNTVENIYKIIPDILLSADIISSFPSETVDEFNETVDFLRKYRFSHIHAFSYSPRPGTVAASIAQTLNKSEKKNRNFELISLSQENKINIFKAKLNKPVYILIEKFKNGSIFGHTDDFLFSKINNFTAPVGEIIKAIPIDFDDEKLICEVIEDD